MNIKVMLKEYGRAVLRAPGQFTTSRPERDCPICGFRGRFLDVGPRPEARCPNCSSKERDRIMGLYLKRRGFVIGEKNVLHFSPERPFFRLWKDAPGYVAGDVKKSAVANTVVDITKLQFPADHFDLLICHHVLEHVPADAVAMAECFRVLKPGADALFSVPLDQSRAETWEPPPGMPAAEIERICGWDHVRLYGRDFATKLEAAGFSVITIPFSDEEAERYRLAEKHGQEKQGLDLVFVATKPG